MNQPDRLETGLENRQEKIHPQRGSLRLLAGTVLAGIAAMACTQKIEAPILPEPAEPAVSPLKAELNWGRINAVRSAMDMVAQSCGSALAVGNNGLVIVAENSDYFQEPGIAWTIILAGLDKGSALLPVVTDMETGETFTTHWTLPPKTTAAKFNGSAWLDESGSKTAPVKYNRKYEISVIESEEPGPGVGQFKGRVLDSVAPRTPEKC